MLVVQHVAGHVVDLGLYRQAVHPGRSEVVHGDGAVVEGVQGVQRFVGLLRAEVAAGLVAVGVVELPEQARPALVELPVDRPGRWGVRVGGVRDERLELRPRVLVVLHLRQLDVAVQAVPGAVPVAQRGVEVEQRAELVTGGPGLVVGVVLVGLRVLPQVRLVLRGQEPADRVQRRYRGPGALLTGEPPRATGVGTGPVTRIEVRGVVPVLRRHPVVRALLLPRLPERRRAPVLRRGDDRFGEVGLPQAEERHALLLRGRFVVAPLEAEHARVIAQAPADRDRRQAQDLVLLGADAAAVLGQLPPVAALVAGVDEDAGPVDLPVEVLGHEVAFEADRVDAQAFHQRDLLGGVGRRVAQEQVRYEAAAPHDERPPVDRERAHPLRRLRRSTGEVRGHRTDPEGPAGPAGHLAVL